jgi:WD40 repeat protein
MWDLAAGTELGSQNTKYEKSGGEKLGSLSVFGASKQEKQQQQRFKNFRQSASKIAVSANGQAAAIGQPDKAIKIYEAQSGREMRELAFKASPQTENSSLAFSADATLVAFAKTSESVCVQEAVTGRERYCVNTGSSKTPQRVQFSSDGRFLVTATANSAALKLWDATTGQLIRELNTPGDPAANFRVISLSRYGV